AAVPDQQIVDELANKLTELRDAGKLQGFGLDLECEKGVVWLSGKVASAEQQMLALRAAQRVDGVTKIVNNIELAEAEAQLASLNQEAPAAEPQREAPALPMAQFPATVRSLPASQPVPYSQPMPVSRPMPVAMNGPQMGPMPGYPVYAQSMPPRPAGSQQPQPIARVNAAGERSPIQRLAYAGGAVLAAPVALGQAVAQGMPAPMPSRGGPVAPASYDHPQMPGYAWPSYAAYPNYAGLTYPKQYSPTAWPYIGPFYPYPQVPLGWRKVTLEWDDGWWMLDFYSK
ncbi:MAG: BON domain-containing protein, partial [Planctomycetales bacterium]|nr:BON domain-containing protein [Planctomycetales bacterium]